MTEQEQVQAAGSAIAAFAMVQVALTLIAQQDPKLKRQMMEMLSGMVSMSKAGGPANRVAAEKMQTWIDLMTKPNAAN